MKALKFAENIAANFQALALPTTSLEGLASKGATKYGNKISTMQEKYRNATSKMKQGYEAQPFGPTVTQNYINALSYMPENYTSAVKPGLESKWRSEWTRAMSV